MQTKTKRIILSASLAFCCSVAGWAQDVMVDFLAEAQFTGNSEEIAKEGNVRFIIVGSRNKDGALVNYQGKYGYVFTVSAPRNIAVIEFQTTPKNAKNDNTMASTGDVEKSGQTLVWRGSAKEVKFTGKDENSYYLVTRARIWFEGSDYDPNAPWEVQGGGGDEGGDRPYQADVYFDNDETNYDLVDRAYSSVNVLPTDGRGVPMAVVSDPKFKETLQPYLEWKTQQGYEVKELYTNEVSEGGTPQEKAAALRQRLMAMNPRPAYVLLVGGYNEVPVFYGTVYTQNHASDCYYGEYNNDHFADAYVGRFCASNTDELKAQLDKTMHMATLSPQEGEWLKHSVTVDGVIDNIAAMRESVKLSQNYPLNFANNVSDKFSPSSTLSINSQINKGCSFVNYFGHGTNTHWSGSYGTSEVNQLTNKGRYPVVLSMTCYTGTFDLPGDCLAEAFMNKKEAGAVAVVAASRTSYADSNNIIFLGSNSGDRSESIGMFRSLFPFKGSDPSQRARTIGQALDVGCLAMARTRPGDYVGPTEMYNLFGDPTYQPYITTPQLNKLSVSSYNIEAGRNITVTTVPDAMVCLSQGRTIIAAVMADAKGKAIIHVPASTTQRGDCTLYTSAPGYNDLSRKVTLSAGSGTDEVLASETTAKAAPGVTHTDVISRAVVNNGSLSAWTAVNFKGTESEARYAICAGTEQTQFTAPQRPWTEGAAPGEGFYLRNNYEYGGIVTTKSGGKARTVAVEWLYPLGVAEVIGVYGSNSAYSGTNEAWNGNGWNGKAKGTKIGELVKGCNDQLTIGDDYEYLLFRAEPHKAYPTKELSEVYIKSLSVGWETELPQCAKPEITFKDGQFAFNCTTEGAIFNYGVAPAKEKGKFVITLTAEADGYKPSEPATLTIDGGQLAKVRGDIDNNGTLSVADIVKLINSLTTKK